MDKNGFLIDLAESDRTEFGRIDFAAQGQEQRVFSAIWALESEVNSGGFYHYFDNVDQNTVSFAPAALRSIGAETCAGIVGRALAMASDRDSPAGAERLESLDSEFYSYPDNLTDLLYAYVAQHQANFGQAPFLA